eukprot:6225609-Pyramimonas_sp.AAC.1
MPDSNEHAELSFSFGRGDPASANYGRWGQENREHVEVLQTMEDGSQLAVTLCHPFSFALQLEFIYAGLKVVRRTSRPRHLHAIQEVSGGGGGGLRNEEEDEDV